MNKKLSLTAFVAVLLLAVTTLQFAGCSAVKNIKEAVTDDPKKAEEEYAEMVFEYLKNEDIDSLSELFSVEMKNTHDIKKEWEDFFGHLDGKVISYQKIYFQNEGIGKDKDGVVYDEHYGINYNGLKTSSGTVYEGFGYYHITVSRDHPETEGMDVFTMKDPVTGEWYTVGGE